MYCTARLQRYFILVVFIAIHSGLFIVWHYFSLKPLPRTVHPGYINRDCTVYRVTTSKSLCLQHSTFPCTSLHFTSIYVCEFIEVPCHKNRPFSGVEKCLRSSAAVRRCRSQNHISLLIEIFIYEVYCVFVLSAPCTSQIEKISSVQSVSVNVMLLLRHRFSQQRGAIVVPHYVHALRALYKKLHKKCRSTVLKCWSVEPN